MIARTKHIRSLAYTMKRQERIGDKMNETITEVTLNRKPFKVYTHSLAPEKGLEVLYIEGENHGKALISPTGFPWFTIKLDPLGKIMRKNQHHIILNSGYDHVISILEHIQNRYGSDSKSMLTIKGETKIHGHDCWMVEFKNPHFKWIPYTVKKGEDLNSIADRLKIGEYMVMEKNKEVDYYDDIKEGQVISIPIDYCKSMVVYIDQKRQIPLLFKIYDDQGLYEYYEFFDTRVDYQIQKDEFTEEYAGYDF